jgi:site-specific recombinase XerD
MPMTRLVLPAELDGRTGRFRAPRELCLIDAPDDRAAIASWLAVRAPSLQPSSPEASSPGAPARRSHTYEAYRKEAERLLLWCVIERRRALSSLTPEDGAAYLAFLQAAPPPAWCGPRNAPRWAALDGGPFEGALARSVGYAASVLGNLFAFLVTQNYLVGNPFRAVRVPVRIPRGPDPGRGLSHELWAHVAAALDRLPAGLASQRLQVALHLLYGGLRLAELVAARTDDLEHVTLRQADGTPVTGWLSAHGGQRAEGAPGARAGRLDRSARALPGRAGPARRSAPGRAGADPGRGARRRRRRYRGDGQRATRPTEALLRRRGAASRCASEPALAARLRQASAHWLRHTCINHSLDGGLPVELVQQNVGHASLDTTTAYVRTEDARRLAAMHKRGNRLPHPRNAVRHAGQQSVRGNPPPAPSNQGMAGKILHQKSPQKYRKIARKDYANRVKGYLARFREAHESL